MRAFAPFALAAAVAALSACSSEPDEEQRIQAKATEVPKDFAEQAKVNIAAIENEYGTPIKDRVVTLGLLNKRNDLTQDLVMKPGESRRFGNVIVKLATCERTLPWERPSDVGAFVQVFVEERATTSDPLAWRKVFSGWLFKNTPSLNAVEHPVYDVWVKDCAMKFPGEEEDPNAAASPSSAAKASGSGNARPSPTPTASPSPSPSAGPTRPPIAAL